MSSTSSRSHDDDDDDDDDDEEDDTDSMSDSDRAAARAKGAAGKGGAKSGGGGKKRKAMSLRETQLTKSEQELAATLELTRDELLNMTSDALEVYARRLASARPLTADEQKKFKRQRRLIKNRESAQLSRMRKKAYVDELEKQVARRARARARVQAFLF